MDYAGRARLVPASPSNTVMHTPATQVGKSTLIRGLVKHYTRQNLADVRGPITCVAGKKRRITLVECPSDLCGMMVRASAAGCRADGIWCWRHFTYGQARAGVER